MKQMMMKRTRARTLPTTRSKSVNPLHSNSSENSHGESIRGNLKTNIQSSVEKYNNLAREALMTGDRVLAESYYQHAEHYLRLINEYKENLVVLPRNEETVASVPTAEEAPASDFVLSIEQELSSAQANL